MSVDADQRCSQILEDRIFLENEMVTIKTLSYLADISDAVAETALKSFYDKHRPRLHAIYMVGIDNIGEDGDEMRKWLLVRGQQVDVAWEKMDVDQRKRCHIHSVSQQPAQHPTQIYLADRPYQRQARQRQSRIKFTRKKSIYRSAEQLRAMDSAPITLSPVKFGDLQQLPIEKQFTNRGCASATTTNGHADEVESVKTELPQRKSKKKNSQTTISSLFAVDSNRSEKIKANTKKLEDSETENATGRKTADFDANSVISEKQGRQEKGTTPEKEKLPKELAVENNNLSPTRRSSRRMTPTKIDEDLFSTGLSSPEGSPVKFTQVVRRSPRKHTTSDSSPQSVPVKQTKKITAAAADNKDVRGRSKKSVGKAADVGKKSTVQPSEFGKQTSDSQSAASESVQSSLKSQSSGVGKRGQWKTETFMDEEGYLVTKKVWVEELYTSSPSTASQSQPLTKLKPADDSSSSSAAKSVGPSGKRRGKMAGDDGVGRQQANITNFFKKSQ